MIERYELIPLTALTSLSTAEKNIMLSKGIILSKNLLDTNLLKSFHFNDRKIKTIQDEVEGLCEQCRISFPNK
jgi:hypothetical protein